MAKKKQATRRKATSRAAKPRSLKGYGWTPDLPDQRDRIYSAPRRVVGALPPKVDLRSSCPPVVDQGQLGSCTANAIAGALEFNQMREKLAEVFAPSRLFIYYNERVIENTVDQDAGAMIRDGIKSVAKEGAPDETIWPYNISQFKTRPSAAAYKEGAKHTAILYQRLTQTVDQLKGCLASGFPFVFGFSVYESFESQAVAKSGRVPMPKKDEKQLGGHAVLAVGYDDPSKRFIVRNSWGTSWGLAGYFTIPYAYLTNANLADDFWTIQQV